MPVSNVFIFAFICCTNTHMGGVGSVRDSGLEPSKLSLSLILTRAQRGWEWAYLPSFFRGF